MKIAPGTKITMVSRGGEQREVLIIDVSPTRLIVRWGIAGTYQIAMFDGELIGARGWKILDMQGARRLHKDLLDKNHEGTMESIRGFLKGR